MTPEQERLFTMLKELVEICEANSLVYYVAGGTTLGAVRHKGFIPWDDDIDIMMPYPDWLRLVELARDGALPVNRVLSCQELDPNYPHVFGRYTDTTSCAIHYNQMLGGTPEGFIIDIFILDPVPDAQEAYDAHCEALSLYNDLSNQLGYSYPMSTDRAALELYAKRIQKEGRQAVLSELAARLSRYEGQECAYQVMRWAAAPRLFKSEIFAFERWEDFEGLRVRVPALCNDYLVQHYGDDWMYVPSASGRVTHDAITFLDVDYKTVQDDYLPFIDVERAKKAILNRRSYHVRHMDDLRCADGLKARIAAVFAREETLLRVSNCGIDLDCALRESRNDELESIFSAFYQWQCSALLAGREEYLSIYRYKRPILVDIGDELLRVALLNLAHTNRVAKADRILRIYEKVKGALSGPLQEVRDVVDAVRAPATLADLGCDDEAFELARFVLERYPENFADRVFLAIALHQKQDFEELKKCCEEGLARFEGAGEFEKYLADCLRFKDGPGTSETGDACGYAAALLHTTHAFIAAEAADVLSGDGGADEAPFQAVQAIPRVGIPYDAERLGGKLAALLGELDAICNREGIDHWLGFTSCKLAFAHGDDACGLPAIDLFVPAGQMDALASALQAEAEPNRAVDCWKTNGNHLSYQIDYVDMTTTFLQFEAGTDVAAHGIKVTILPVRKKVGGRKGAWLDLLETGWEVNGYRFTKKVTGKRIAAAGIARAGMVGGRKRLAKRLYKRFSTEYAGIGETACIRLSSQESFTCDARHFQGFDTVTFFGREFPVPRDARLLLERYAGANWEDDARALRPDLSGSLVSADMPYAELLDCLNREGLAVDELFALMRKIRVSMLPMANDLRIRSRAMAIARRSEDRKRCCDYLDAHAEEIDKLVEAQDFERLDELFADYERCATAYLKQGLGLCPSKKYLDILCTLLRQKGMEQKAEKLERLAPKEHYGKLGR